MFAVSSTFYDRRLQLKWIKRLGHVRSPDIYHRGATEHVSLVQCAKNGMQVMRRLVIRRNKAARKPVQLMDVRGTANSHFLHCCC